MKIKLFDSELNIIDVLWKNDGTAEKRVAELINNIAVPKMRLNAFFLSGGLNQ